MAVLLEDVVKSVELLVKLITKSSREQAFVDPSLNPVLLVPGIAGSILNTVNANTGKSERVWVRILRADHELKDKLWSRFDPATGKTVSLDTHSNVEVPQDRYGLYAIDSLDPDMVLGGDCVYYFHEMIIEFIKWGYQEGTTLFGFGYDFRQSNRLQDTMDQLASKLESIHTASGGKKINIISHSMGGLLMKCFMNVHSEIFKKYVNSWIAIAAPFQGAPGYITSTLLNGASFVEGWKENFFIKKWSMHQLLIECPSIYELMACTDFNWEHIPLLEIWRKKCDSDGNSSIMLESYPPSDAIQVFAEALSQNKATYDGDDISLPFNMDILKWANETRKLLGAAVLPDQIKFYNIYGTSNKTAHSVCYGSETAPVSDLLQLHSLQGKYIYVDGDGTVPVESAMADGLHAEARIGVAGDHRGILCDRHVFRILKHWLKADHDPFYNPLNDYVILPTAFEIETLKSEGLQVTTLREEWEVINDDQECNELSGSIAVHQVSSNEKEMSEEAVAAVAFVVKPSENDRNKQHVEVKAVSISASA